MTGWFGLMWVIFITYPSIEIPVFKAIPNHPLHRLNFTKFDSIPISCSVPFEKGLCHI